MNRHFHAVRGRIGRREPLVPSAAARVVSESGQLRIWRSKRAQREAIRVSGQACCPAARTSSGGSAMHAEVIETHMSVLFFGHERFEAFWHVQEVRVRVSAAHQPLCTQYGTLRP